MNTRQWKWAAGTILLIFCLSAMGCSLYMGRPRSLPSQAQLNKVLSGKSLLGYRVEQSSLPEDNIFEVTPEMLEFLKSNVPRWGNVNLKLQRLIDAVTNERLLGMKHDTFKTYGAADTFNHRRGNCLSFAILMVVLGRELGLKMDFNEVDIPPIWDMHNEQTLALLRHVNVITNTVVIDHERPIVTWRRPDGAYIDEYIYGETRQSRSMVLDIYQGVNNIRYPQHKISDKAAEAQYYNNRGVDNLHFDNTEQAFLYFRKALELEPEQAFIWINMGVLYLRNGYYQEAEAAFLHALELDSSEITAISNLQHLYVKQGNTELAEYYRQEAERSRMKNPYYRYILAKQLLDDNQPDLALKHIKWAIRKYREEHRFYYFAARVYARLGRRDDVEKSLKMAAKLTEDDKQKLRYQSKLERLRKISREENG